MTAIDRFAAHVGVNWADKKHDVCVQFKNGERTFHVINHTGSSTRLSSIILSHWSGSHTGAACYCVN